MILFHTWHSQKLSQIEITQTLSCKLTAIHPNILVTPNNLDNIQENKAKTLGSCVKISRLLFKSSDKEDIYNQMAAHLQTMPEWKLHVGFSQYGHNKELFQIPPQSAMRRILQQKSGRSIRAVMPKWSGSKLGSAQVFHGKLLQERGCEFHVIISKDTAYISQSIWVQDFESFAKIDYDRPSADPLNGMMPPKLAQMLINMATKWEDNQSIYDPFCGSWTIPMMALYLGHRAYGSDISQEKTNETKQNLRWFTQNFATHSYDPQDFEAHNAMQSKAPENSHIVSEGYLGTPQKKLPNPNERKIERNALVQFYIRWLWHVTPQVKAGKRIVFTAPVFQVRPGKFELLSPYIKKAAQDLGLQDITHDMGDTVYARDYQIVGREVFVFEKK